jgi:3-oxoacyl-[acyl-carrier-protein] synthase-3
MQPFVINSHGRMVFPSNFLPELDFSVIDDLGQLEAVIRRDFEAKAPSGTDILQRIEAGDHYSNRFELMRDVALNMFWTNRFAMTMYDKRPTRWRDVPRNRDDVFLPVLTPWEDAERKVTAIEELFAALPATWDGKVEDRIFQVLFDVLRHRRFHATELPAVKPTVAEILAQPDSPPTRWRPTTPTTRSTATSRSSTAPRTSPSWRPCTGGPWSCTTSTRGTARTPGSLR